MPEIAGLPYVISGLVAAGGLAAALSTADGLLLTISNALSHDFYFMMIDPSASVTKRLAISRTLLVITALDRGLDRDVQADDHRRTGGLGVLDRRGLLLPGARAWGSGTSARTRPARWPGCGSASSPASPTWSPAVSTASSIWGIKTVSSGLFGIPLGFIVTYVVSRMTPPPSQEMQDFVESVRIPRRIEPAQMR